MSYSDLNIESPVRDFVNDNPQVAIGLFSRLGIDFCCGGGKPLREACEEKALDPEGVLGQLHNGGAEKKAAGPENWVDLEPSQLIDHIVTTHHLYMEGLFPELINATAKVIQAHGKNHPELYELEKQVRLFVDDMKPHMMKEERVLFPMIKNLEANGPGEALHCGSVQNPIRVMRMEHDRVGEILQKIRELTQNYSPPADACETFKHLYRTLERVEQDTHLHVHKENNLLFPMVSELIAEQGSL